MLDGEDEIEAFDTKHLLNAAGPSKKESENDMALGEDGLSGDLEEAPEIEDGECEDKETEEGECEEVENERPAKRARRNPATQRLESLGLLPDVDGWV